MTTAEAINIIELAVAEVEWEYPISYAAAFEMAIEAMKEKQERENPKPLTIEELRQMEGDPIFIKGLGWRVHCGMQFFCGRWHLFTSTTRNVSIWEDGKMLLEVFRHKPSEG